MNPHSSSSRTPRRGGGTSFRRTGRKQLLDAVVSGLRIQAALTACTLAWLFFSGTIWRGLAGNALFYTSVLVLLAPAWVGGFVTGYRAPSIRGRHLATPGLFGAFIFLAGSFAVPVQLPMELRLWLSTMLVLHPWIAGTLGHWVRLRRDADDPLTPRPWLTTRAGSAYLDARGQ